MGTTYLTSSYLCGPLCVYRLIYINALEGRPRVVETDTMLWILSSIQCRFVNREPDEPPR